MDPIMNNNGTTKNVLSADVEIKGNLKFSGELTFEGKLDGEIQTEGTLHLGETANINGNITAQSVIVRGKVNGNITAKEKIEIKSKAELFGDIPRVAEDLRHEALSARTFVFRDPREIEHRRGEIDVARPARNHARLRAGDVDEERNAHHFVPNFAAVEIKAVLAACLAVIAG